MNLRVVVVSSKQTLRRLATPYLSPLKPLTSQAP